METAEYLDRLLLRYSGSFDIYQPYTINEKEYPAYGYFFSCVEKYVLVREANMWTSKSYEHILFMEVEECSPETLHEIDNIISEYMEPLLVRKGQKLPEKQHMYSYLSIAVIAKKAVRKEVAAAIKKYKFEKGYQFSFRGYSQARIMCSSMENESFISNYQGRKQKALFLDTFQEVHNQKPGFKKVMEERGLSAFSQT